MLPPRDADLEDRENMTKEEMEGVALAFPDSGSAGNTNNGNTARRTLLKEHLRERLVSTVPEQHRDAFRYRIILKYSFTADAKSLASYIWSINLQYSCC